jgi:hypothetical protein
MKANTFLLLLSLISFTACKSLEANKNSFNNEFFNNTTVIYHLKNNKVDNEINILDSEKLITNRPIIFKKDSVNINIVNNKTDFIDFDVRQYTINKDLAFIVLWKFGKNEALWFLFNKGKQSKKWYLVDTLKRTTR